MMGEAALGVMALNDAKAGMTGLDKDKINKIIEEASKGSKYYEAQQRKQRRIDGRVREMKDRLAGIKAHQPVDALILELERKRDLSRTIVHVDMDAYYAAVEMLGPPVIPSEVPIAVGSSGMLSTSNYAARKFGVRAGMPGFIGKKLCPSLRIIPPDFKKYTAIAEKIREVFAKYDANYAPMSLDEAYLDITEYLQGTSEGPEAIVERLRTEIFESTGLTASAGIAPNTLLAKVASDQNKPNGQFYLQPNRDVIMEFVGRLPVRKIGGIGNVTAQLLSAIGIQNCSELFSKLSVLKVLFSENSFENFGHIALGLGANTLSNERERKSMSVESTFRDTGDKEELTRICRELSKELSDELIESGLKGKVITLKIKTDNFEVKSRAKSLSIVTNDPDTIGNTAENCLKWFLNQSTKGTFTLRLMGVRMSEFGNSLEKSQITLEHFLINPPSQNSLINQKKPLRSSVECPNCSLGIPSESINSHLDACLLMKPSSTKFTCPVCSKGFTDDSHIDDCLSRKAIEEMLNEDRIKRPGGSSSSSSEEATRKKLKTIDSYFKP